MAGYQTGVANRMSNDGTYTYTYDDAGNTIKKSKGASDETWTYSWDHNNRLTVIEKRATDGGTLQLRTTFTYDAQGNLIQDETWKTGVGTTTTRMAVAGGHVWARLNGSNALQLRHLFLDGTDQLFARIDGNGTAAWYLTDRLGSVRVIMNSSGATQKVLDYNAFGKRIADSAPSYLEPFGYTAREWFVEILLQYNRNRWYDVDTGRWMSEDPIGFEAGDPNLLRYVKNNPLSYVDPFGRAEQPVSSVSKTPATDWVYLDEQMMSHGFSYDEKPQEWAKRKGVFDFLLKWKDRGAKVTVYYMSESASLSSFARHATADAQKRKKANVLYMYFGHGFGTTTDELNLLHGVNVTTTILSMGTGGGPTGLLLPLQRMQSDNDLLKKISGNKDPIKAFPDVYFDVAQSFGALDLETKNGPFFGLNCCLAGQYLPAIPQRYQIGSPLTFRNELKPHELMAEFTDHYYGKGRMSDWLETFYNDNGKTMEIVVYFGGFRQLTLTGDKDVDQYIQNRIESNKTNPEKRWVFENWLNRLPKWKQRDLNLID
jgi:RHS repeat-associated protein